MKIALFFPYGPQQRESASAFSLAALAEQCGSEVYNITCSGVLSACDLDKQSNWERKRNACFNCQCSQNYLQSWSGFNNKSISEFLDPEFVEQSRSALEGLDAEELLQINYFQIPLESICQGVFNKRYGKDFNISASSEELYFYRSLLLNSLRTFYATRKLVKQLEIDLLIVSGHEQLVSKAALLASNTAKCDTLSVEAEQESGRSIFRHSAKEGSCVSDMLISDISFVRRDLNSWPVEFQKQISKVAVFIGAQDLQIALPFQEVG
jgi:hypothetical protein